MTELKCPFCQQKLKDQWVGQNVAHEYFDCPKCKMNGNPKLWQELIRTRKALDVAVDALKIARDCAVITSVARGLEPKEDEINIAVTKALEQITALEQKDVK